MKHRGSRPNQVSQRASGHFAASHHLTCSFVTVAQLPRYILNYLIQLPPAFQVISHHETSPTRRKPSGASRAWRPTCRRMGPRSSLWVQLPSCYRRGSPARPPCRLHTRRRCLVNRRRCRMRRRQGLCARPWKDPTQPPSPWTPPRPAHISTEPRAGTTCAGLATVLRARVLRARVLRARVPMARVPRTARRKRTSHAPPLGTPLGARPPQAPRAVLGVLRRAGPRRSARSSRRCSTPSPRTA